MDSYISFDQQAQAHQNHQDDYEQVPCFSIFSNIHHTNSNFNHTNNSSIIMEPSLGVIPFKNQNVNALYGGGTTPYDVDSACLNTDLNFEGDSRKVLKAFVDQIAKLERNNQISNVKGSSPSRW